MAALTDTPLRYLDVCAGISASTVAWQPLGWQAAAYAEIDAAPRAILAHHYPDTPLTGDFTEIRGDEYGAIDLLVGGTPCQDFSVAGLRKGLDGERGNLSLEFLRLADRARPRWLVWENVPGVLSINGGRAFGAILGGLGELGYGFAYRILDAQHFGVPQRRRRVFVVGYLGDWRRPAAVLFERHSMSGHPAPRREARQVAPTIPSRRSGGGGLGTDFDCDGGLIASTGNVPHCLNAGGMGRQDYETETLVTHALRGEGFDASEDGTGRGTPIVPVAFNSRENCCHSELVFGSLGSSSPQAAAVAFAENSRAELRLCGGDGQTAAQLTTGGGKPGQGQPCIAFDLRNGTTDETAMSVQAGGMGDDRGLCPNAIPHTLTRSAVRRLTPRECERLQGFPDDYTLVPYRKGMMADGPRYKALGNSMAVPVMRWIGERIQMIEAFAAERAAA